MMAFFKNVYKMVKNKIFPPWGKNTPQIPLRFSARLKLPFVSGIYPTCGNTE